MFVIDEAHYLMNDATSLEFLETAVRHSRHYDLSIQFITQTGGEFALTPEARTIANLCSVTLVHRVKEEAEKLAEWFELSEREVTECEPLRPGTKTTGFPKPCSVSTKKAGSRFELGRATSKQTSLIETVIVCDSL